MKKLLALLLALCMLLSLAACSDTASGDTERDEEVEYEESDEEKSLLFDAEDLIADKTGEEEEEEPEEEKPAEEEAAPEEAAPEEAAPEEEKPAEEAPAAPEEEKPAASVDISFTPSGEVPAEFESQVLLDDEYCTVTLADYDPDGSWGPTLTLELVNKTDAEIMFSISDASVNGLMLDPYWACSVDAGGTKESDVSFDEDDLEYVGINYLQEICAVFRIYNNDDWSMDEYFEDEIVILLPAAGSGEPNTAPEHDFAPVTLLDNGDLEVTVLDYEPDGEYGPELKVLTANHTDKPVYFGVNDAVVNGVVCDPFWGEEVFAGMKSIKKLYWDEEDLEAVGINYLKDLRFLLEVNDTEEYDNYYSGEITLTLEGGSGAPAEEVFFAGFEDVTLVEEKGIAVVAKNFDMEGYWGPTLTLYLENGQKHGVYFSIENAWVNGIEIDPYWGRTVMNGAVAYAEVDWDEDEFAEQGIETVETIELEFYIYDSEDWSADDIYEGTVTLTLG